MKKELKILDKDGRTLFDDAHYVIPPYQRAYAWEDREIGQLIDDINGIDIDKNPPENYYIGSLIVSKVQDKADTYEVVDGQQRLITLFLLLQCLLSILSTKKDLKRERDLGQTLSFACRQKSDDTLEHIQEILYERSGGKFGKTGKTNEPLEESIVKGIWAIHDKLLKLNIGNFVSRLKRVVLFRIEVPEHTDLNRYFEIMNTRGEQLEQHDILKAKLMGYLTNRHDQEIFSKIWNACSDMTGYVQMHFVKEDREKIFKGEWNDPPPDKWEDDCKRCLTSGADGANNQSSDEGEDYQALTIKEILEKPRTNDTNERPKNTRVRFKSIIDFPYFLLHALRVFVKKYEDSLGNLVKLSDISLDDKKLLSDFNKVLDDKKLLSDFNKVIDDGKMNGKDEENFSREFIVHLLKTRYLFDRYIIKQEYSGEGGKDEYEWSLKKFGSSRQKSKELEPDYSDTYSNGNKKCLMIQSALRVSYTSPGTMHWITELIWQSLNNNGNQDPNLTNVAEFIAAQATKKDFLDGGNYKLGVGTPHIVFNFLDYLLWKAAKDKGTYKDFKFKFRNSVEHWYPQHPSVDSFDPWTDKDESGKLYVDGFGNLCIISRSVNSKFSNLSPTAKKEMYKGIVEKGSIKLRIMGEFTKDDEDWKNKSCQEHEDKMIRILEDAVKDSKKIKLYFVNTTAK